MSATNRGGARITADNYPTPHWCVEALLAAGGPIVWPVCAIDPFAGDGEILEAVSKCGACERHALEMRHECAGKLATRTTQFNYGTGGDTFTDLGWQQVIDDCMQSGGLLITNPPFSRAADAVALCCGIMGRAGSGIVAMLLPLSFLGSAARDSLFASVGMPNVYVLPDRPSFAHKLTCTDCGGQWLIPWNQVTPTECINGHFTMSGIKRTRSTDASVYAWFVWTPKSKGHIGSIARLPAMPAASRA